MQSGIPTESRRARVKRLERQTDATGSIVRCDCWRGTSLFDTQSKHVWWTSTRGIWRTRKGHKFVFRIQNLDETHLKILQETMRLIVLMVFVYLDVLKGMFHNRFTHFSFLEQMEKFWRMVMLFFSVQWKWMGTSCIRLKMLHKAS